MDDGFSMTECCKCGRKYWPGKNECPGRAQQQNEPAKACNHKPCWKCQHYVDDKEESYERATTDESRGS